MPRLIRFYLMNCAIGAGIGLVFTALLLATDAGGLRHLVFEVRGGWLGGVLLVLFHALLFAGVQFGIAIMSLAGDAGAGGGRTRPKILLPLAPLLAESQRPPPPQA